MPGRLLTSHVNALPAELLDAIIDSTDRASLRACLSVSPAFRLRALYNLMSNLSLSLLNASLTLPVLQLHPTLPRALSLNCVEFDRGTLTNKALKVLPRLTGLRELQIYNVEFGEERREWRLEGVKKLVLEGCSFDADSLDAFLSCFPALGELHLSSSVICKSPSTRRQQKLPWTGCVLDLKIGCGYDFTADGSFRWASKRSKHFIFRSLHLTPWNIRRSVLSHRLEIIGPSLQSLHIDIGQDARTVEYEEIALRNTELAIALCTGLKNLDVRMARLSDMLYIKNLPTSCESLRVKLIYLHRRPLEEVRALWTGYTRNLNAKHRTLLYHDDVIVSTEGQ